MRLIAAGLVGVVCLIAGTAFGATYYVWTNSPADGPGTTWGTAFHTIQGGVDAATDGDTVLVTNGLYNTGARVIPGYSLSNRVVITNSVMVESVNGPEHTLIAGQRASWLEGFGPDAVRCVYITNGTLSGFTITNGYTQDPNIGTLPDHYGGGVLALGGTVSSSIITGCAAEEGGGLHSGTANNCIIRGNRATFGGGANDARLNNCTVAANSAYMAGGTYLGTMINTIVYSNAAATYPNYQGGEFSYSCTYPHPSAPAVDQGGNVTNFPEFADFAAGDYRLQHWSPCVDTGTNMAAYYTNDLGKALRPVDGNISSSAEFDIGAYEFDPRGGTITVIKPADGDVLVQEQSFEIAWIVDRPLPGVNAELHLQGVRIGVKGKASDSHSTNITMQFILPPFAGPNTGYFMRVVNSADLSVYGDSGQFEVIYASPHGVTLTNRSPEFGWGVTDSATWYDLWLHREGTNYYRQWADTNSWTADIELHGGDYFWWIRPWANGDYIGSWSQGFAFTIQPIAAPVAVAPTVSVTEAVADYLWTADPMSTWYELLVYRGGSEWFRQWVHPTNGADITYTVSGHQSGARYDWWVRGWHSLDGYGPFSAKASFIGQLPVDEDSDGLPDWWEIIHMGGLGSTPRVDSDGDGSMNYFEYASDTNPTNSSSRLIIDRIEEVGGDVRIDWQGGIMATQYLEVCADLAAAPQVWTRIHTNLPPTLRTNSLVRPAQAGTYIYRIRTPGIVPLVPPPPIE